LSGEKTTLRIPHDVIRQTKGFLSPSEGERLYDLAREVSPLGPCLEIGSYCGKSALYLGAGCHQAGGLLYSVDHHRGSEEQQKGEEYFDPELYDPALARVNTLPFFQSALAAAGLTETVRAIVAQSQEAAAGWDTPLALVFIDGGHSFQSAHADYRLWSPHLLPGGVLAIHDIYDSPSQGGQAPRRVWELAKRKGPFREESRTGCLGVLRRM